MKKYIILLLLSSLVGAMNQVSAQEVYNYVLQSSSRIVDDPTSSFTHTRIAQFKKTALVYLKSKATETMPEVTDSFLNEQAYHLSEFIAFFIEEVVGETQRSKRDRKKTIINFINASLMNPLFNDDDTETTECYFRDNDELTPFSLNTDWVKAYNAAVALKKMKNSQR